MADRSDPASDLLHGGRAIALAIYGSDKPAMLRRLYHEQDRWPVFKLDDSGVLYALRSRLQAHLETKSAEKEARILAAARAAAASKTAQKAKPRRRRPPRSLSKAV